MFIKIPTYRFIYKPLYIDFYKNSYILVGIFFIVCLYGLVSGLFFQFILHFLCVCIFLIFVVLFVFLCVSSCPGGIFFIVCLYGLVSFCFQLILHSPSFFFLSYLVSFLLLINIFHNYQPAKSSSPKIAKSKNDCASIKGRSIHSLSGLDSYQHQHVHQCCCSMWFLCSSSQVDV